MKRLALLTLLVALPAQATPYRLIAGRSGHQAAGGNLEFGLRYMGLFEGEGALGLEPDNFHQVAAHLRWGVFDRLELEAEASLLVFHDVGQPSAEIEPGDIELGGQIQLVRESPHILAVFLGFTFPTGPSDIDVLPPFFADGTFDFEGRLIYELAPAHTPVRLVFNFGYEAEGTRKRGGRADFDVPDALVWDAAFVVTPTSRLMFSLELDGWHYFDQTITPVWRDDQNIVEVTPGLRFEITPRLVFEGGAGIALNDDTRRIYKVRVLAGLTYEFHMY